MIRKRLAAAIGVLFFAGPAFAQAVDPHQPWNDGSAADSVTVAPGAVAPGYDPDTRAANLRLGSAPIAAMDDAQAAYHADLRNYDSTVQARNRTIAMADARYARQRRAYAEAMNAWRGQVAACQAGNDRACRAPAPDPASFY